MTRQSLTDFTVGDIVFNHIGSVYATDQSGIPLYHLTQVTDGVIETNATKDTVKDKDGNIIRQYWHGKSGTLTLDTAMVNVDLLAAQTGADLVTATDKNALHVPRVITVKNGTKDCHLKDYIPGTAKVSASNIHGATGKLYPKSAYTIDGTGRVSLPKDSPSHFVISYLSRVTKGVGYTLKTKDAPIPQRIIITVLGNNPCDPKDDTKIGIFDIPYFHPAPVGAIHMDPVSGCRIKGAITGPHCTEDKPLYSFYWLEADAH